MVLTKSTRESLAGYLFIAPNFLGFMLFAVLPVLASFGLGLTSWNIAGQYKFIGLSNYIEMFTQDPKFYKVLGNTIYFSLLYIPLVLVCSIGLAMLVNRPLKGVISFRFMYFLPVVTSAVAASMVFQWMYNTEFGLLNYFLGLFGLGKVAWLTDRRIVMLCVVIVNLWKNAGRLMVIYLAGLQGISRVLYEAAEIDGAGPVLRFFKITLPMLSPTTFFILITSVIDSFQIFEIVFTLTGGGPLNSTNTIVTYIYEESFNHFRMGYACSLSMILFTMIFIFTVIQFRLQKNWVQSDVQ
ncbi:carbohydrate ABC transporter permease [Leadbettera azotonutricia]|uniref:Inner membrane protein n=1 Tax=Leadbettera azotonutricia (strain ATCC BAA-888 / DSM 13862 / ZAS-9) TaxID=545695 RepID=F5YF21_LEAAZ|nr:sugar ABC transporter permease [Leadbettera azotonutricia]AEF81658.1 inner membrane protein [Leadbettera azotonutricia ZAS-9]